MIRIKMRAMIRSAGAVICICALVYLMAGYEIRLNTGVSEWKTQLLLWRLALYTAAAFFWFRRVRPHLRQRCPERRIRRTEYLMLSLVIPGELTGVMRGQ